MLIAIAGSNYVIVTLQGNRVLDKEESNLPTHVPCALQSKETLSLESTHTNKCRQKREAHEAKALMEKHERQQSLALALHKQTDHLESGGYQIDKAVIEMLMKAKMEDSESDY